MQVKLDGGVPPSTTPFSASDFTSATSKPIPSSVPHPVSPLTTICTVHNHLSTLGPTVKFPAPQLQVSEDVEVRRYNVEIKEFEAPAQEAATVDAP